MLSKVLVKADLKVELLEGNTSMLDCKGFVDEFDSKDWSWSIYGSRFFDTLGNEYQAVCTRKVSYQAYAPCPIVLDTMWKGSSLGSGASCECTTIGSANTALSGLLIYGTTRPA